jgi:hypothetical protein
MNQLIERLTAKIREFHPAIDRDRVDLNVTWDEAGKRYAIRLSKAGQSVGAYLDQQDAEDCLSDKKCVNLAVQVTQLWAELEDLITPRKPG